MKKFLAMILCALMLLSLAACAGETDPSSALQITRSTEDPEATQGGTTQSETQSEPTSVQDRALYAFVTDGITLTPGEAFDASVLPEPESTFTVPSCAIDGSDNVYNYGTFEVTAYDEGNGEILYSVLLIDPNLTTPEGLALGDSVEKMVSLYGEDYQQEGTGYYYTSGVTRLSIIAQDGVINSIEYVLVLS